MSGGQWMRDGVGGGGWGSPNKTRTVTLEAFHTEVFARGPWVLCIVWQRVTHRRHRRLLSYFPRFRVESMIRRVEGKGRRGWVQVQKQLNFKPRHSTKFVCANFDKFAICFVCVCCLCVCACKCGSCLVLCYGLLLLFVKQLSDKHAKYTAPTSVSLSIETPQKFQRKDTKFNVYDNNTTCEGIRRPTW